MPRTIFHYKGYKIITDITAVNAIARSYPDGTLNLEKSIDEKDFDSAIASTTKYIDDTIADQPLH